MPRPTDKNSLLNLGEKNYQTLKTYISTLDENELNKEFPEGLLNRNIRDVLAHLHHWHILMIQWHKEGMQGKKPAMPAKGYTWKTLPEFNLKIRNHYNGHSLKEVEKLLDISYKKVRKVISNHSEEELFTKKKYKWTGSTSMGAYLISSTSSHYDWAYKLIKKCLKAALTRT